MSSPSYAWVTEVAQSSKASKNNVLGAILAAVVVGGIGLSYAAVPLYRLFCQVTGFAGTTQVADGVPSQVLDRRMTIRFNADVDPGLPWSFQPVQREVTVRVGEPSLAFYRATNHATEAMAGTATFNVTPFKAGGVFDKIDCFCFSEQHLGPGESAELPVSFFIDPSIAQDKKLDDVSTITLSYTFFRVQTPAPAKTAFSKAK